MDEILLILLVGTSHVGVLRLVSSYHHASMADSTHAIAHGASAFGTGLATHFLNLSFIPHVVVEALVMRFLRNDCLLIKQAFRKSVVLALDPLSLTLAHAQV